MGLTTSTILGRIQRGFSPSLTGFRGGFFLKKPHNYTMEYKVVPFTAHIDHKTGFSNHVSLQLEQLINKYAEQGWEYLQMETVTKYVSRDTGRFGLGAK